MGTYSARQYYQEAQKQGQKEYKTAINRGQYPYILALHQVEPACARLGRVNLGRMELPLYLIVGSTEEQRCNSFSPGFYPLLDANSEFADKWIQLCASHLEEGIRDPIKCYEYMGRFYVTEGNKRVSVLKAMGAVEITAEVTRLVPIEEDTLSYQIYEEFLEFFKYSRHYGLHFSQRGCYARLQAAFGLGPEEPWSAEFRRSFQSSFLRFRSCYVRVGGGSLALTTGDALLLWLRFYTPEQFLSMRDSEYRQSLTAIWPELCAATDGSPIAMNLGPLDEEKPLGRGLLPFSRPKKLRVAFLFQSDPQHSPWTAAHDQGRAELEQRLPDHVSVTSFYDVTVDNADEVLQQAIDGGAELIFTTTVNLLDAALRTAVRYPKVQLLNCSIDQPYVNVRTYYSRVYEGKFITGAIAGAMSPTGRIGYVGSYPILGVPASINAFALGAAMTNPDVQIELKWHCVPGDCMASFREEGITVVSDRDINGACHLEGALGLFRFNGDGTTTTLASPRWNWGEFYVRIVLEMLWGRWKTHGTESGNSAINYWWGMSSGVVDLLLSSELPEGVRALAKVLKAGIQTGTLQPFERRIVTQDGRLINDGTLRPTIDQILKIDWFSDHIHGRLPDYDELLPVAKPLVDRLGLQRK
jgi:basic membrane lipoprotein Med (substrate-binding protein (PBP1-ABC) superfamily)